MKGVMDEFINETHRMCECENTPCYLPYDRDIFLSDLPVTSAFDAHSSGEATGCQREREERLIPTNIRRELLI